jgi:ribosomal protein S18 acetylase RimI-like enzyme
MLIRAAAPRDVPMVLPMVREVCSLHESWDPRRFGMLPDVVDRYARWLPERAVDPRSVFLVADIQAAGASRSHASDDVSGPIVGYLVATIETSIPIYRVKEFGLIHDMWVDPAARRRGIARALVTRACDEFARLGVEAVRLETAVANASARDLFESCGFRASMHEMQRDIVADS